MTAFERVSAPNNPTANWCAAAGIDGTVALIDLDRGSYEAGFESVFEIGGPRIACSARYRSVFAASFSRGVVAAYSTDSRREIWRRQIDAPQTLVTSDLTGTLFVGIENRCTLEI